MTSSTFLAFGGTGRSSLSFSSTYLCTVMSFHVEIGTARHEPGDAPNVSSRLYKIRVSRPFGLLSTYNRDFGSTSVIHRHRSPANQYTPPSGAAIGPDGNGVIPSADRLWLSILI